MSTQYRVIIAALEKDGANPKPIYEQVVEDLDIKLVITAVNSTPSPKSPPPVQKPIRRRSRRSDAGKPRQTPPEQVTVLDNV